MSTPTTKSTLATPSSSTSQSGRLFTDTDEIRLLKTYYKITKSNPSSLTSSSSSSSSPITVDPQTYQRINKALNSKFTHSQITDKLRRLRVKYHKHARSKSLIRTPHDQEIFNLARKTWGKKTKQPRGNKKVQDSASSDDNDNNNDNEDDEEEEEGAVVAVAVAVAAGNEQGREKVDLEEYPALVSEFSKYLAVNSVWREGVKLLGNGKLREMNEQWMSIGIEEAKIVTKKADLVKEQTQLVMQILQNGSGGTGN
ncbi:hypothetical protein ACOSQ2_016517 [Xanthoceras sorbifolium]